MTFVSIIERNEGGIKAEPLEAPSFFVDLNLDQIVDAVTEGRQEYNLKPFFYRSLMDIEAVTYRQEIMRDLENGPLSANINAFAEKMRVMRRYLGLIDKLYYKYHKNGWFLETVDIYCNAVTSLVHDLNHAELKSQGLTGFREYLASYTVSDGFKSLLAETKKLKADLSTVKYCLLIQGGSVKVRRCESEIDYSADVEETFEKFKQGAVKDYRAKLATGSGMNHVEAAILDMVTKLYPDIFLSLDNFCTINSGYLDETIAAFDREIQFYIAYLAYIAIFKQTGLNFCYPEISSTDKEVNNAECFDMALARKHIGEKLPIVCNGFYLKGRERIFVVSGPNQGGKTTFARTFGQLHYLAALGCPVPGRQAKLFLFDRLFTHFENEENIKNLRGKLQDDLVRIYGILSLATPNSVVIINEIFTSTTLKDAVLLGRKILDEIIQLDLLCVCVTFIDELASLGEKTVSMVSTVVPENPASRTYKIIRAPADGLAYALSIAEKYRVTYDCLRERLKS